MEKPLLSVSSSLLLQEIKSTHIDMNLFYPEIILSEMIRYQQEDFKNSCKQLFRIKDVYSEGEDNTRNQIIRAGYNYFAPLSKQLREYVATRVDQNIPDLTALLFANLKSLKLEVDTVCSNAQLDSVIENFKAGILNDNGRYEEYVDEETGEVLTNLFGGDDYIYYTDSTHINYCQFIFEILVKEIKELLYNYSKSFDDNYSLFLKSGVTSTSLAAMNTTSDPVNPDEMVVIPHKLYWDEQISEFEAVFSTPHITLMNGSTDRDKILSVLKEVFIVGEYGGVSKNSKRQNAPPVTDYKPTAISQKLEWLGSAKSFAEFFAPLITVGSNSKRSEPDTTIFFDFSKVGVRNPIVKILYNLFYITDRRNINRIEYSYLKQEFKEFGKEN